MDYLGWELERQRAALRALLGGGRPEEEGTPRKEASAWGGGTAGEETRRSPADPGAARRRAALREAGRYAGGGEEAGGPLAGAPGVWEMLWEAAGDRALSGDGGPETPESVQAEGPGGEAWAGNGPHWGAETGAPSRRRAPEGDWSGPRAGSRAGQGKTAEPWSPSGGRGAEWEEQAAEAAAEMRMAAEIAGARGDGEGPSAGGRGFAAGGAGQGEPLTRLLSWGEGRESAALQAEDGAKALSRAVQRDARRYDGGFTIY